MLNVGLKSLPIELLARICFFTDISSLGALSLVDHFLHSIAIQFLFRDVTITLSGINHLDKNVVKIPQNIINIIRHLTLEGRREREKYPNEVQTPLPVGDDTALQTIFFNMFVARWPLPGDEYSWDTLTALQRTICAPIAELIIRLPHLKDLTYNFLFRIPLEILDALHSKYPTCRLHINTFQFAHLDMPDPSVQRDEFALLTSPSLYSISTAFDWETVYLKEALLRIATGLAPNLKRVNVSNWYGFKQDGLKLPWQGFKYFEKGMPKRMGSLDELILDISEMQMDWFQFIDSSKLRSLKLLTWAYFDHVESLLKCNFSSLEEIALEISFPSTIRPGKPINADIASEYHQMIVQFLCGLPCLKHLQIRGDMVRNIMDPVLNAKGARLKTLYI
jgi:hypothetical protein